MFTDVSRAIERLERNLITPGYYKNENSTSVARTTLKRVKGGLCYRCGKRPHEPNGLRCKKCLKKQRIYGRKHYKYRPPTPAYNAVVRKRHAEIKREVFEAYGGAKCACCGESIFEFLSLDHEDNNSAQHRRSIFNGSRTGAIYRWLLKHHFPPGFQVLCMNCKFGKRMNGGICPHKAT